MAQVDTIRRNPRHLSPIHHSPLQFRCKGPEPRRCQRAGDGVAAQYPDPADYCTAMLFNQASQRFKMEDLLEDVDGFNIALKLKNNPSLSIADALTQYYKPPDNHSGYQSRLRDFWNARFAAVDVANRAPGLVYGMLFGLGADGGLYEAAKRVLQSAYGLDKYDQVNIPYISPSVSARFCQRLLTVYKDLMNKEAATFS